MTLVFDSLLMNNNIAIMNRPKYEAMPRHESIRNP